MPKTRPRVGIVMGSDSDLDVLREAIKVLDEIGIPHEVVVASAHRTPDQTRRYATRAESRGIRVLIAGAGGAAALPGFLASLTSLPIIGVPINSTPLNGLDSLLSIAQMPKGVPVATVAVGKWGAANAGILAAEILALSDARVKRRLAAYRKAMAAEVKQRSRRLSLQLKKGQ
jgi:5-(carboxyamino)imidazole ribonucleotide mutase